MSKQTRRTISIAGTTYDQFRDHAAKAGRSMSDVLEELIAGLLGMKPPRQRRKRLGLRVDPDFQYTPPGEIPANHERVHPRKAAGQNVGRSQRSIEPQKGDDDPTRDRPAPSPASKEQRAGVPPLW